MKNIIILICCESCCNYIKQIRRDYNEQHYFQKIRLYPALTGSKTPTSKFSEIKEVRFRFNCP
ncbi:hypothetical protein FOL75_11245 [Bacillus thuringiensis]|nr:hypothetical protein [Bacillus thuringiensis]RNG58217.1 hypothetical protein EEL55_07165 [Bacillus thuringiensis]RUR60467.1 hypothetical protein ELS81_25960 [Bacillus sp. VKPM B-3276]